LKLEIEYFKFILDNAPLLVNLASVELGLLVGMWLRGRFIDKTSLHGQDVIDFGMFSIVLIYLTLVATFSDWPIPVLAYAGGGVILPPFTLPLYNALVASAPNLLKSILPEGIIKWVLEHTQPPAIGGKNNEETGVK